jgi:hypothetical protein
MFNEKRGGQEPGPAAQAQDAVLGDAAEQWLSQLPPHVRPRQAAARFPHIANALALSWARPSQCRGYFDQLLLDHRGNRQGFPKAVAAELAALKDYYDSVVHPTQQTVWDEIVNHTKR